MEVSEKALAKARQRNAGKVNITFRLVQFPRQQPGHRFNLVLLSEVVYYCYWGDEELDLARDQIMALLKPEGDLLLVY